MRVGMLDLAAEYALQAEEIKAAALGILESGMYVLGAPVEQLEKSLAAYVGSEHALGLASGTDALILSQKAMGVGPGDEVITGSFGYFASASTTAHCGGRPVFVDVDPVTFNLEPEAVEAAITPKTKAIVAAHMFGLSADMDAINEIARAKGVKVIEDAAQAIGAEYKGRKVCSIGDAGIVSFYPTKNLGAAGDGGMVFSDDKELIDEVRVLRFHGERIRYFHDTLGTNSRLDAIQAAVLNVKFKLLDDKNNRRREIAQRYNEELKDVVGVPVEPEGYHHVYHAYTIHVPERDKFREYMIDKGVGCAIYYPLPLHKQEAFGYLGYTNGTLPVSEKLAEEVISIPVCPTLTDEQVEYVIETVKGYFA